MKILKKGRGWRVGWNPTNEKYKALVGNDDWAFELTIAEFKDFARLLDRLIDTMKEMKQELMDSERISCEAETDLLWLELEGYPDNYTVRLILSRERRCEGNWDRGIAPKLAEVTQRIIEENSISM